MLIRCYATDLFVLKSRITISRGAHNEIDISNTLLVLYPIALYIITEKIIETTIDKNDIKYLIFS